MSGALTTPERSSAGGVLVVDEAGAGHVEAALAAITSEVDVVSSIEAAIAALNRRVYAIVLIGPLDPACASSMQRLTELRGAAAPTPIGVLAFDPAAEPLRSFAFRLAAQADAAALERMVFDARKLQLPSTRRETQIVRGYFATLASRDWEGLASLLDEEVVYHLPAPGTFGRIVVGREALVAYLQQMIARFNDPRLDPVIVYEQSHGSVARCLLSWIDHGGQSQSQSASAAFRLRSDKILRVGIELDHERFEALAGAPPNAESAQSNLSALVRTRLDDLAARSGITSREREVLGLVILGRSSTEIATTLGITPRTAKFHVGNVLRKLGADSRRDLLRSLM